MTAGHFGSFLHGVISCYSWTPSSLPWPTAHSIFLSLAFTSPPNSLNTLSASFSQHLLPCSHSYGSGRTAAMGSNQKEYKIIIITQVSTTNIELCSEKEFFLTDDKQMANRMALDGALIIYLSKQILNPYKMLRKVRLETAKHKRMGSLYTRWMKKRKGGITKARKWRTVRVRAHDSMKLTSSRYENTQYTGASKSEETVVAKNSTLGNLSPGPVI